MATTSKPRSVDRVEEAGLESFPASDPPSWTLGIEEPGADEKRATRSGLSEGELTTLERALETKRDELRQKRDASAREEDQHLVQEVLAALERMRQGTYGVSERTGRPIPYARLAAAPWARAEAGED